MKKIIAFLLLFTMLFSLIALTSCSQKPTLDKIKDSGKMVVYLNANFSPYEYTKEGTEIAGVDIDIANAIAAKLGVTLEIKDTNFDGIISAIATGKGDIAISGITITDERKKEVDFSNPYVKSVQYLILPQDSTIACMEDLEGKKIGSVLGYTGEFIISDEIEKGVLKDKNATVTNYNSAIDGSLEIGNKVDVVVMDELVALNIVKNNPALKAIKLVYKDGSNMDEEFGVAVRKNNQELLDIINEVIDELKANGKIDEFILNHST